MEQEREDVFSPSSCSPLTPCPCSEVKWLVMLTVNAFISLTFQWGTPPESWGSYMGLLQRQASLV